MSNRENVLKQGEKAEEYLKLYPVQDWQKRHMLEVLKGKEKGEKNGEYGTDFKRLSCD